MTRLKDTTRIEDRLTVESSGGEQATVSRGITMRDGTAPTVEWVERTFDVSRKEAARIVLRYK